MNEPVGSEICVVFLGRDLLSQQVIDRTCCQLYGVESSAEAHYSLVVATPSLIDHCQRRLDGDCGLSAEAAPMTSPALYPGSYLVCC